ncbi:MAG: tyrosine-protein phosphatase [Bdellovibrionales bacterium]|nr:tyrosine-protein phosphatase [Bdellovibrionales bacterium]
MSILKCSSRMIAPALMLSLGLASAAQAGFTSPFPSEIPGISVPNTHLVAGSLEPGASAVIRGMAPRELLSQLLEQGVTDFLIFKNETHNEVEEQIQSLRELGLAELEDRVSHIPFKWRGFGDAQYTEACNQVREGLLVLREVLKTPGRRIFFHCTVGEDRTGMLAGLFRSLNEGWSVRSAFFYEMCENGYEAGNPDKPEHVNWGIRNSITPLYVKMGFLAEKGFIKIDNLDDASICNRDPKFDPEWRQEFTTNARYDHHRYRCRSSSKYPEF